MRTQVEIPLHPRLIEDWLGLYPDASIIGASWDPSTKRVHLFVDCEEGEHKGVVQTTDKIVISSFYAARRHNGDPAPTVTMTFSIREPDAELLGDMEETE